MNPLIENLTSHSQLVIKGAKYDVLAKASYKMGKG